MKVLVFSLQGVLYAAPLETVEAVRPPALLSPLPFAPPEVLGLVGVGGQVLPLLDLAQRLAAARSDAEADAPGSAGVGGNGGSGSNGNGSGGSGEGGADRQTSPAPAGQLLVARGGSSGRVAVAVDRALTILEVGPGTLHALGPAGDPATADGSSLAAGEFCYQGTPVILLSPSALTLEGTCEPDQAANGAAAGRGQGRINVVTGAVTGTAGGTKPVNDAGGAPEDQASGAGGDSELARLVVEAGGERYGFDVQAVIEVYNEQTMTALPKAPAEVCGLSLLRGHPRLVVSLARLLGRPDHDDGPGRVMVAVGGAVLVFRVAGIAGLRRFPRACRQPVAHGLAALESYLIGDDDRVIGALALERLIDAGRLEALRPFLPAENSESRFWQHRETRSLMTFQVGNELCGLDVARVERLTPYSAPVELPDPTCRIGGLAGVIEVGGRVLPVVDLRTLLGGHRERPAPEALVVLRRPEGSIALAVDALNRLVELPVGNVRRAGGAAHRLVVEIGRHEDQLISILDPDGLDPVGVAGGIGPGGGGGGGAPEHRQVAA